MAFSGAPRVMAERSRPTAKVKLSIKKDKLLESTSKDVKRSYRLFVQRTSLTVFNFNLF